MTHPDFSHLLYSAQDGLRVLTSPLEVKVKHKQSLSVKYLVETSCVLHLVTMDSTPTMAIDKKLLESNLVAATSTSLYLQDFKNTTCNTDYGTPLTSSMGATQAR